MDAPIKSISDKNADGLYEIISTNKDVDLDSLSGDGDFFLILGYYLFTQEKYPLMEGAYNIALQKGQYYAAHELGRYYDLIDDKEQAFNWYNVAIKKTEFYKSMHNVAMYYKNKGDSVNAIKYMGMSISKSVSVSYIHLAQIYEDMGKINKMLDILKTGAEVQDIKCIRKLGKFYSELDDIPNMLKYYNMGIENNDPKSTLKIIKYYQRMGDHENAEKYMQIGKSKRMPQVILQYAEWLLLKDNEKDFIDTVNLSLELGETSGFNLLGNYHKRRKEFEDAKKYYMEGINKGDIQCLFSMAIFYQTVEKKPSLMEEYYRKSMENGRLIEGTNNLAVYYLDTKQVQKAIEILELLMEHDGDMRLAFVTLGTCYEIKKDYANMLKYWIKSISYGCNMMKEKVSKYLISNTDRFMDLIIENYKWMSDEVLIKVNIKLLKNDGDCLTEYRTIECQECGEDDVQAITPNNYPVCMRCYVEGSQLS